MLRVEVLGGAAVTAYFKGLAPKAQVQIQTAVTRLTIALLRKVKEEKLSGQVLKNRTGTLRRKVNYRVTTEGLETTGTVGVKLSYAAVHEFGFDGVVTVRAHLRRLKAEMRASRATKRWFKKMGMEMARGTVREHQRHMKLPERSFLRSALKEMEPQIRASLLEAVRKAVS